MNKKYLLIIIALLVTLGTVGYIYNSKNTDVVVNDLEEARAKIHDGTYVINSESVRLVLGKNEFESAPGSASKTVTKYFGNDVSGDFDNDGRIDNAFLITQETGGSGVFYYVVALLDRGNNKLGTEAYFLGDRIAPQNNMVSDKEELIINYAIRNEGESFDVAPSIGKSLYLILNPNTLVFTEKTNKK